MFFFSNFILNAHKVKEAIRKALFKLKPALNLLRVPVVMSIPRSAPRETRVLPITAEMFATGSNPVAGFAFSPTPALNPT